MLTRISEKAVKLKLGDPGRICRKCSSDKESIAMDNVSPPYVCPKCRTEWEQKQIKTAQLGTYTLAELSIGRYIKNREVGNPSKYQSKTFENFELHLEEKQRKNQEKIIESAETFCCAWGSGKFSEEIAGLVFWGPHGTGKNHIASAVTNKLVEEKNITPLHVLAYDMYLEIKECFKWRSQSKESDIIKKYVLPDLLTVNEIEKGYGSDQERRSFFNIFSKRIGKGKQTIIISNKSWEVTQNSIGVESADRFKDGVVLEFIGESYRGLKKG